TVHPGNAIMAGTLIGIYNYVLKFVSGLDTIPYTVQRLTSLTDITRRIELEAEDFPPENIKYNTRRNKSGLLAKPQPVF
ncbi:MAG TPA: hypothetical protein VG842_05670, partial [Sediminibacterium sp.]|nr:hypothetical protein [Sediminibacterium sp.]